MINNWMRKADIMESVYDLYFSTIYQPLMRLRHKFLSRIHALEIYHRNTKRNYELESPEHENRIREILESVPHKHREWVENILQYSNEPSMRQRIADLVNDNYSILKLIIKDKKSFMHKLINTRNYCIHYNQELKDQAAKGVELYKLTQICKIIIDICLLTELGFDKETTEKLSLRNWEYKYGLQQI